jgi:hypothetical protein
MPKWAVLQIGVWAVANIEELVQLLSNSESTQLLQWLQEGDDADP